MRDCRLRLLTAASLASALFAPSLSAQSGLGQMEDASLPPPGVLRLRAITAWTRYDQRFTATGVEPLGADFNADALGTARLPALAPIESRVQAAAATPFKLSLGHSQLGVTGREEILPLAFEYGVTRRFAVGITVPIVRKRVAIQFRLDTAGGFAANVGPNANGLSATVRQTNGTVQSELAGAAAQLTARLQSCQANPGDAGCSAVLAQAPGLLQTSSDFAADLAALYGSGSSDGMPFVPMEGSAAQQAIAARIGTLNAEYQSLLGSNTALLQTTPVGAAGPAGTANIQKYLTAILGRDSLTTQERVGIGDLEFGFKYLVFDRARTNSARGGVGARFAVTSALRLPTGSRQSPSDMVDLRLGDGSVVIDSRAILDLQAGRLGLLAIGQFAASVRDADTARVEPRNSTWTELQIAPRWHFSRALAVHGAYSARSGDVLGGDQLIGGGLSFTTVSDYERGAGPLPFEMRFTHLEAMSGDPGRPKFFRDQLEVRIYYRLFR